MGKMDDIGDKFAKEEQATQKQTYNPSKSYTTVWGVDGVKAFIARHEEVEVVQEKKDAKKRDVFVLKTCLNNPEHTGHRESCITVEENGKPGYICHHDGCHGVGFKDILAKLEPDDHNKYGTTNNANDTDKPEIQLPFDGFLVSEFAECVGEEMKNKDDIFFRSDTREVVEVGKIKTHKKDENEEKYTGFLIVKPNRCITLLEKYIDPGYWRKLKKTNDEVFVKRSINSQLAMTIMCSEVFQDKLKPINRVFTTPLPIIYKGNITFPKRGYDERFSSWLPHDAPTISEPNMSLVDAKKRLHNIFKEFCFERKQDYCNAISGLLKPFLRGLYRSFRARTPLDFYIGNRERVGKDYLAGITGIVYEGCALEDPPISTNENKKSNNSEEFRKKITAALMEGRKRIHFANNKGFINNAALEAVLTIEQYSDRLLGENKLVSFPNEMDFSGSGNRGVGFTPDLKNRCCITRLFLDIEDANKRNFENPELHKWILENRDIVLSALYALVRNWINEGQKPGTVPFASFPDWSRVCGGVMESAGYLNPCNADKDALDVGDTETEDMKQLFELCFDKHPNMWMKKSDIVATIEDNDYDIFGYVDFAKKSDQTKFGKKLTKYIGRCMSDIYLHVEDAEKRGSRQKLKFAKIKPEGKLNLSDFCDKKNFKKRKGADKQLQETEMYEMYENIESGNVVTSGNLPYPKQDLKNKKSNILGVGKRLPRLPRLPPSSQSEKDIILLRDPTCNRDKVVHIINKLGNKDGALIEEVKKQATESGITDEQFETIISNLKTVQMAYEPRSGMIMFL